jgi:hypothetical protein
VTKPTDESSIHVVCLDDALPLLDSLEFAITDWLDRRKHHQADIVLVVASVIALNGWAAANMAKLHKTGDLPSPGMASPLIAMAMDIMRLMDARRKNAN